MREILRDNWKWIVTPIVLLVVGLVLLAVFGGGDDTSPFQYSDF